MRSAARSRDPLRARLRRERGRRHSAGRARGPGWDEAELERRLAGSATRCGRCSGRRRARDHARTGGGAAGRSTDRGETRLAVSVTNGAGQPRRRSRRAILAARPSADRRVAALVIAGVLIAPVVILSSPGGGKRCTLACLQGSSVRARAGRVQAARPGRRDRHRRHERVRYVAVQHRRALARRRSIDCRRRPFGGSGVGVRPPRPLHRRGRDSTARLPQTLVASASASTFVTVAQLREVAVTPSPLPLRSTASFDRSLRFGYHT